MGPDTLLLLLHTNKDCWRKRQNIVQVYHVDKSVRQLKNWSSRGQKWSRLREDLQRFTLGIAMRKLATAPIKSLIYKLDFYNVHA